MRILSLDTSFSFFNLSVVEEGRVTLLHYIDSERKTLENLPLVLSELCLRPEEFDAFAVSIGVGYLTSLRIGVTFVKTLAYNLKKPVVSYENLYLLGVNTPFKGQKVPYLRVSTNLFYRTFRDSEVSEVKIYREEELKGLGVSLEMFSKDRLGEEQFYYPFFPFSAYGGVYAHRHLKKNPQGENLFEIEPLYLKPPV